MPPKKSKKNSRRKGPKKPKFLPDPDAGFNEVLEREFYIPKCLRSKTEANRRTLIREAMNAFTLATPESVGGLGDAAEPQKSIPMTKLASIVRAVGLCPTTEQLSQLSAMVAAPLAEDGENQIDREKCEVILLKLLDKRVLLYEPLLLEHPHHDFPTRVISVVYTASEVRIRTYFDTLWKEFGCRTVESEGVEIRCLGTEDVKTLLENVNLQTGEDPFSQNELDELILSFRDSELDVIREDTFLLTLLHVP